MSYSQAVIAIGGPIPHHVVDDLCRAITEFTVSLDWDDAQFEPESAQDLLDAVEDGGEGVLLLTDNDSPGSFGEIEVLLKRHGIPFESTIDGDHDGPGSVKKYRPGMGTPREFDGNSSDDTYLTQTEGREILSLLEAADMKEDNHAELIAAIRTLRHALGLDIPPLPPFTIAAEEGTP